MRFLIGILMCIFLVGCQNSSSVKITVYASVSLKDVLPEVITEFQNAHPNIEVDFVFGPSRELYNTAVNNGDGDIFLSSSSDDFRTAVETHMIDEVNMKTLLSNNLVVAAKRDEHLASFESLTDLDRIGIAHQNDPAGQLSREVLERIGIWSQIESKIVNYSDVRDVLLHIENNSVDAGIVYETDVRASNNIAVIDTTNTTLNNSIIYTLGVLNGGNNKEAAIVLYNYLQSDEALVIFREHGFGIQ